MFYIPSTDDTDNSESFKPVSKLIGHAGGVIITPHCTLNFPEGAVTGEHFITVTDEEGPNHSQNPFIEIGVNILKLYFCADVCWMDGRFIFDKLYT